MGEKGGTIMSENENTSEQFSTAAELRSYIENNLEDENTDVYPHTGLVQDGEILELMNFLADSYVGTKKGMPYHFEDTKLGGMLRKNQATKTASKAVKEGNISQMKFISGKQSYNIDATSLNALIQLRNRLEKDAYILYLFGHMGHGKTDFAILLGELAKRELNFDVASNIKSFSEKDKFVENYGSLLKWLANGKEVSSIDEIIEKDIEIDDKLFIFDEASSHASGYSDDAYDTQRKLGVTIKKIRKVGGRVICIGHTGKDLHPDVRRLAECAKKVSKKTIEFYETVTENGKGKDLKKAVSGIPKTNWNSYDTQEITSWDWSEVPTEEKEAQASEVVEKEKKEQESKDRRDINIAKAVATNEHPDIEPNEKGEITQEMLAEHYNLTTGRISQIVKDIKNEA